MTKKILINATQAEELRVAVVDETGALIDLDIESSHRVQKKANIYKARVSRIEPSLNAVFVDYGAERHGFLPMKELAPKFMASESKPNLREGQEILIQVEKEERGTKGAAVTTFITLAGCYLVLMPNSSRAGGVSRRIEGEERQQLKSLLAGLVVPKGMGVIARTACLGRTEEELQWDLDSLLKLWNTIVEEAENHSAPFLIFQESDIIMRSVRDYLRQDIDEILVDDRKTYERVLQSVKTLRPDFEERVRFYHHDIGLFTYYRIESQIETAFLREVKLSSGGSIVIDHTEALTSIDINSAKATKGGDIEETALQTNLEAAREIARQMKLRDLGGLVVIDFIDMENSKNQRLVEETLDQAVQDDRARIQLGKISRFGLLELSRQRLRPSLEESSSHTCPRCNGQGTIRGIESISLSIVRLLQEESMRADTQEIHIELPLVIMVFLGNEKRHLITQIEIQNKVRIVLIPNPNLETPNYNLSRLNKILEDGKPSYHLPEPMPLEAYRGNTAPLKAHEQPAIRALSMEKAPVSIQESVISKMLESWIAKVKSFFVSQEKSATQSSAKAMNSTKYPDSRKTMENRPNRNERRPKNNDRRRQTGERNNVGERDAQARRGNERRDQQINRLKKPEYDRQENPGQKKLKSESEKVTNSTASITEIIEHVPVVIVSSPERTMTAKISPSVQAILDSIPSAGNAQIETTVAKEQMQLKFAKEEVVEKTDFSVDAARDFIKKQHAQTGLRVETEAKMDVLSEEIYTKQEQIV